MIRTRRIKQSRLSLLALLALAPWSTIRAEMKEQDPVQQEAVTAEKRCLSLLRIDSTDVVDDKNILFYMKNDEIYVNRLPHRCPGLNTHQAFMYRTSMGQLCSVDIITVLDGLGFGYSPGISCVLGGFYPITEEAVIELKAKK